MSFSISLGWWLLPAVITAIAFAWAGALGRRQCSSSPKGGDYNFSTLFDGIFCGFVLLVATVVSLIAWLVYALAT
jgi:hypothetical protein